MKYPTDSGRQPWATSQLAALTAIRDEAKNQRPDARSKLAQILRRSNRSTDLLAAAMRSLQEHARVVLHFHPDRLTNNGLSVAESMLVDGVYRSQFETGISNGSPTAFAGGDRDLWEKQLFRGAYHVQGVTPADRPKYGSLQVFCYADGPSPRFGSCYFVMRPEATARCSFTYGDSHTMPDIVGTIDSVDSIMAALLQDIEETGSALGSDGLSVAGFLDYLACEFPTAPDDPARLPVKRNLDEYIEAQVHGPIELGWDIDRLVADPSYRGTKTGMHLHEISVRYGIPLQWHPGFVVPVDMVPDDFRGPSMPAFARWVADIAGKESLDAAAIGAASASLGREPESWRRWGTQDEALRLLRQAWHVVVKFGIPGG